LLISGAGRCGPACARRASSRLSLARRRARRRAAAPLDQHEARGADRTITDAIDTHVQAEQGHGERDSDDDDGEAGALARWANGPLMARKINNSQDEAKLQT
jgi:hypothetical protein